MLFRLGVMMVGRRKHERRKMGLGDVVRGRKANRMTSEEEIQNTKNDPVIREIIELERSYFFEKRNVKTERRRKLRDLIERHTKLGDHANDS